MREQSAKLLRKGASAPHGYELNQLALSIRFGRAKADDYTKACYRRSVFRRAKRDRDPYRVYSAEVTRALQKRHRDAAWRRIPRLARMSRRLGQPIKIPVTPAG